MLKFLLLILIISSCCKSNLIDTIRFSDSDLIVNPYTGNEILKFIDDTGSIITYNNGYRKTSEEEIEECDGGCCDHYLVEKFNQTYYESPYMQSNLQIIISNNFDKYSGSTDVATIHFAWDYFWKFTC